MSKKNPLLDTEALRAIKEFVGISISNLKASAATEEECLSILRAEPSVDSNILSFPEGTSFEGSTLNLGGNAYISGNTLIY